VRVGSSGGWVDIDQYHLPPRPKPSRRDMMPSFFLAALNFLLSVIDWRSPSSRSALALTSRSVRYGTTGESGFEECDGGWNATAGTALPITANDALRRCLGRSLPGLSQYVPPASTSDCFPACAADLPRVPCSLGGRSDAGQDRRHGGSSMARTIPDQPSRIPGQDHGTDRDGLRQHRWR
jgi:hypothetical protein